MSKKECTWLILYTCIFVVVSLVFLYVVFSVGWCELVSVSQQIQAAWNSVRWYPFIQVMVLVFVIILFPYDNKLCSAFSLSTRVY